MQFPRVLLPGRFRPLVLAPGQEQYSGDLGSYLVRWIDRALSRKLSRGLSREAYEAAVRRSLALLQPYLTDQQFERYVMASKETFVLIKSATTPNFDLLVSDQHTFHCEHNRYDDSLEWFYYCTYILTSEPPPDLLLSRLLMARTQPYRLLRPPLAFRQTIYGRGSAQRFVNNMKGLLL